LFAGEILSFHQNMIQRSNSSTMLNFAQFQYLAKRQISSGPARGCSRTIAMSLIEPVVSAMACFTSPSRNESSAGTLSGLCRERSLRAYDGVVNVVGNPTTMVNSGRDSLSQTTIFAFFGDHKHLWSTSQLRRSCRRRLTQR
jgi:hypothetical protein